MDLFAVVEEEKGYFSGLPQRATANLGLAMAVEAARISGTAQPVTVNVGAALLEPLAKRGGLQPITLEDDDLVVDGEETLTAVKQIIDNAHRVVIIHSTFIGPRIDALLPSQIKVVKYYKEALQDRIRGLAESSATLRHSGRTMHAKFVVWGDNVLLTSFDILSGSPEPDIRGAEVGVLIKGPWRSGMVPGEVGRTGDRASAKGPRQ